MRRRIESGISVTQALTPCPSQALTPTPSSSHTGKAVLPFGFGLSYSTFTYTPVAGASSVSLDPVRAMLAQTYADNRTFPSLHTLGVTEAVVSYNVNVTNTGTMDADDVVLGFLVPPGAGQNGVPLQTLFGFERVHVKAGATVSVNLYPSLTDLTHTLADGSMSAAVGEWTVRFGVRETAQYGQGYAELSLVAY